MTEVSLTEAQSDFLVAMARRYCWDMPDPAAGAAAFPERFVRRVMDFGVLDDLAAEDRATLIANVEKAGSPQPLPILSPSLAAIGST